MAVLRLPVTSKPKGETPDGCIASSGGVATECIRTISCVAAAARVAIKRTRAGRCVSASAYVAVQCARPSCRIPDSIQVCKQRTPASGRVLRTTDVLRERLETICRVGAGEIVLKRLNAGRCILDTSGDVNQRFRTNSGVVRTGGKEKKSISALRRVAAGISRPSLN